MYTGPTIFSQLMPHLPGPHFHRRVRRSGGNHKVQEFNCADHFRVMACAPLTCRESWRDIAACLRAMRPKLYHMGIHRPVARHNLSHANARRDGRISAEFAQPLIVEARKLSAEEELAVDLDAAVDALDSPPIDLCLSMFPWARFRQHQGAVKRHTLLNLRGSLPEFILIADGKRHDVKVLDHLVPAPGAYYVMDRGGLDFKRLSEVKCRQAFFVTRAKSNFNFKRRYSRSVDRSAGILCDQTIIPTTHHTAKSCPEPLRRIKFRAPEDGESLLVFLTNDCSLPARTITQLDKSRGSIELCFKWIQQPLRIKAFYGTSPKAVKTQIWTARSTYLLVAILKKRLAIPQSLYTILQILSVSRFEKIPILEAFQELEPQTQTSASHKQLLLWA